MIASCTILRGTSLPVARTALLARDRFFPLLLHLLLRCLFLFLLHHQYNHHHHYYDRSRRPHRHHDGVQRSCRTSHSLRVSPSVNTVLCVAEPRGVLSFTRADSHLASFLRFTWSRVELYCTGRQLPVECHDRDTRISLSHEISRETIANKKCELLGTVGTRFKYRKQGHEPCPSFASRETEWFPVVNPSYLGCASDVSAFNVEDGARSVAVDQDPELSGEGVTSETCQGVQGFSRKPQC